MRDAQTVPYSNYPRPDSALLAFLAVVAGLGACVPVRAPIAEPVELLLIPAALGAPAGLTPMQASGPLESRVPLTPQSMTAFELLRLDVPRDGSWIAARSTVPPESFPHSGRAGVLAFGTGAREPAAVLRVLHVDTSGRRRAAADVRRAVSAGGLRALIIVPAGITPRDVEALFATTTEFAAAARAGGAVEVILAVAGADTTTYPSRPLATVANALLIGVEPPATTAAPGPPVTTEEMRRVVALRAAELGRARLVLLVPTHGYVWMRDSLPRSISFEEGVQLAADWRAPLQRDALSQALYARSPARGELWLADGRVLARLVREARTMGIRRFAAVLGAGEDPAAPDSLAASLQTTSSSP